MTTSDAACETAERAFQELIEEDEITEPDSGHDNRPTADKEFEFDVGGCLAGANHGSQIGNRLGGTRGAAAGALIGCALGGIEP